MTGFQKVLIENPHIKEVYFDENGGFVWSPSKLHPVCKSREELLADLPKEKAIKKVPAADIDTGVDFESDQKKTTSKPEKANNKKK